MKQIEVDEHWWRCLPAVPSSREHSSYPRLMRLFADHTLNGKWNPAAREWDATPRTVYRHGGEDNLVLAFFENFVLDGQCRWVGELAERLGIAEGPVREAKWSYAFEERVLGERRPRIADVVIHWRDVGGEAIIVIEAKRPGAARRASALGEKDQPDSGYYLRYSLMRGVRRRKQMLLVSASDVARLPVELAEDRRVITWEDMVRLQIECSKASVRVGLWPAVYARLSAHYAELGLASSRQPVAHREESPDWSGVEDPNVRDWLMGSDAYFANRKGGADPPFAWLADEPDRNGLLSRRQTTADRERAHWCL